MSSPSSRYVKNVNHHNNEAKASVKLQSNKWLAGEDDECHLSVEYLNECLSIFGRAYNCYQQHSISHESTSTTQTPNRPNMAKLVFPTMNE